MISNIRSFFEKNLLSKAEDTIAVRNDRLPLATAALMFELMKTDNRLDNRESEVLQQVLKTRFSLDAGKLAEIVAMAETESHKATSLYEFTSLINAEFNHEERVQLVENLWEVAFADNHLDRYEDHLIRKVADLIHVRHSDFIRTKLAVKARLEGTDTQ